MPIPDVNELFAAPWLGLRQQILDAMKAGLTTWQLNASDLTSSSAIKYQVRLSLDNPIVSDQTEAPPGIVGMTPTSLQIGVPADPAGWSLSVVTHLNGFAKVFGLGATLKNYPIQNELQSVKISGLRMLVDLQSDDFYADRASLTDIGLTTSLVLELSGFVNCTLNLHSFDSVPSHADAFHFQITLTDVEVRSFGKASLSGTLAVTVGNSLSLAFDGHLEAGPFRIPTKLKKDIPLPQSVGELLRITGVQQDWGRDRPQPALPVPADVDFATAADAIEQSITEHAPYGALFDLTYAPGFTPCTPAPHAIKHYYGADDSAIWTGHYLAAEAFRYAAARQQGNALEQKAALERVDSILNGIDMLFRIPEQATADIAGPAGQLTGLLCRAALPQESPVQTDPPLDNPAPADAHNYYGPVTLDSKVWYGLGRDEDPPSRDSHTGIMLGLGCAFYLVEDPSVQVRERVTTLLEYLLSHGWNVPTPSGPRVTVDSDGTVQTTIKTSFLFEFHQQLAFLRVGKTVDPGRFGSLYDQAAGAADFAWLPIWGDCLEPIGKYYKFNLDHAALGLLFLLEADEDLRKYYLKAFAILRHTIGHHRNAYFNLWWMIANREAADGPAEGAVAGVTLAQETRSLLCEWHDRVLWVPGANCCLPRKETPSENYLRTEIPQSDFGIYHEFGAPDPIVLAKFALPVNRRPGRDMDFCWQRPPFLSGLSLDKNGDIDFSNVDIGQADQEASGVDFLLPYWMLAYLGI